MWEGRPGKRMHSFCGPHRAHREAVAAFGRFASHFVNSRMESLDASIRTANTIVEQHPLLGIRLRRPVGAIRPQRRNQAVSAASRGRQEDGVTFIARYFTCYFATKHSVLSGHFTGRIVPVVYQFFVLFNTGHAPGGSPVHVGGRASSVPMVLLVS